MPLRIRARRRRPANATTVPSPSLSPKQTSSTGKSMSPLPESQAETSGPHATNPVIYRIAHHTSLPSHSTAYENFLLILIATYLLWALFYGFYILLRIGVWLFEQLENVFTQVMAVKFRQPDMVYEVGCITETWMDDGQKNERSGKMRLVDSGVWIPVHAGSSKTELKWIVRRRSGTI